MRAALTAALRARDPVAVAALRSALSALANATAVPAPSSPGVSGDAHFAGSVVGLGAAEVARRELTPAEAAAVVRAEVDERLTAAAHYPPAAADRLRAEAAVLQRYAMAVGHQLELGVRPQEEPR